MYSNISFRLDLRRTWFWIKLSLFWLGRLQVQDSIFNHSLMILVILNFWIESFVVLSLFRVFLNYWKSQSNPEFFKILELFCRISNFLKDCRIKEFLVWIFLTWNSKSSDHGKFWKFSIFVCYLYHINYMRPFVIVRHRHALRRVIAYHW